MVPESVFSVPVVTGAVIVGPLLIGAAILALIGVGAVYLSGGKRQSRRISSLTGGPRLSPGKRDPLDEKPLDELRLQAGELLVAADNAVQSSEQELLFASASYGDEQVTPFQKDLDEARQHLSESFRLQQQVDTSAEGDEDQSRDLLKRIISSCEKVNQTLQSHKDEFDGLRNLERDPGPALDQLSAELQQLEPRHGEAESVLGTLAQKYDDDALSQYRDNLTQAAEALSAAGTARQKASRAVDAGNSAEAVLALHSGEQATADARHLIESLENAEERLRTARKNLDIGIAQTEQDIAQAKATYEAGQAPELAGPIAAAQTAVTRAQRVVEAGGRIDPLELLQSLEIAHRELDAPLNSIRDRQAKDRRAREMLQTELLTARNQVQSSVDFLRARRYGVSSTARTRMAEAERCLSEAQSIGDSQPARALELAQQAKTLAVQAAQFAEREAATQNMEGMGGGIGGRGTLGGGFDYGTGGGFGGYGHTTGHLPGGYGFGYGRRRRRMF